MTRYASITLTSLLGFPPNAATMCFPVLSRTNFWLRLLVPCWLMLWTPVLAPAQGVSPKPDSTAYATYFPPGGRQVLRAAELENVARQWLALHQLPSRTPEQDGQYRLWHDRMMHRLWVAQLQVSATAAALDNEEERAEQVVDFMRERQDRREHRFTVASIVVGGLTSVISGIALADHRGDSSDWIGVVGGIAGVSLSLPSLLKPKKSRYEHRRNALAALWLDQNETGLFPPMVWRYINDRPEPGVATLRDELVDQWRQTGRDNALYFSEGGRYTADELATRSAMLDQAESYVKQIQQAISEVATTLEMSPPTVR